MNDELTEAGRIAQRLDSMPKPEVENFLKASKEELAREVVNLRLFVAQLFLEVKGMREKITIYDLKMPLPSEPTEEEETRL